MDEQELNKKLAEWAGVPFCKYWGAPEHDIFTCDEPIPSFTQSLDACFKWLVPKAVRVLAITHRVRTQTAQEVLFRFWLEERWRIDEPDVDAPALCLAIEKLVGKENEVEKEVSNAKTVQRL